MLLYSGLWSAVVLASLAWHQYQGDRLQTELAVHTARTTASELMLIQRIESVSEGFSGLGNLLEQRRHLLPGTSEVAVRVVPLGGRSDDAAAHNAPGLSLPDPQNRSGDSHTVVRQGNQRVLRLLTPITITAECLGCHRTRPYQLGAKVGDLEVLVPLHGDSDIMPAGWSLLTIHALAWSIGMLLLIRHALRGNHLQRQLHALDQHNRQSDARHRAHAERLSTRLDRTSQALDGETDIRKKQKARLTLFTQALQQTPVGIIVVDWLGHIEYVNPKACEITAFSPDELLHSDIGLFCSEETDPENYQELAQAIRQGKHWQGPLFIRTKDGTLTTISESAFPLEGSENHYSVIIFTRDDKLDFGDHTLRLLAYYDPITHLPNRREFRRRLEIKVEQAEKGISRGFALIYLDLDDFGELNAKEGHTFGNVLLRTVGQRLRHSIRSKDVVGRLEADLFGVILSDVEDADIISSVTAKMRAAVNSPLHLEDRELHITASIGVTVYPEDTDIVDVLLQHADVALYRARRVNNEAIQFYSESIDALSADRIGLRVAIEDAIATDGFHLAYLPTRPVGGGPTDSAEVLIRLDHPNLGPLAPETFLQVAEDTGLIIGVGTWVFNQALREATTRRRQGLPELPLTFNASQRQLEQPDLPETLVRLAGEHSFPIALLGLEFREDALYNGDQQIILDNLSRLHAHGIRLILDRFGSGLFSLRLLDNLPLDEVKIDRSFIHSLDSDPSGDRIIFAIINLARGLSLTTIATGVETEREEQLLERHGCDRLQGKLCSGPVEHAGLIALIKD